MNPTPQYKMGTVTRNSDGATIDVATGSVIPLPPVSPSTNASVIGTNPLSIPLDNSQNTATSFNGLVNSVGALQIQNENDVNNLQKENTSAVTQKNNTQQLIQDLMLKATGQQADQLTAEQSQNLPLLNKELQDLQNTARQQNIEYQTTPYSLQGQGRGITTGILRGQEAVKQRQIGIDLLVTNSNIAAKQGNIQLAQSLADKAVAAKYDPIKAQIEINQAFLDMNYKDLSRSDQKLADAQKAKNNLQLKEIEDAQKKEETIQQMIIDAQAQQAPAAITKAANDLAANGGTPAQIATVLGKYSGAAAKAELLREQIKTEGVQREKIKDDMKTNAAQRSKIYQDIANSKAEMGGGVLYTEKEAKDIGVPYGTVKPVKLTADEKKTQAATNNLVVLLDDYKREIEGIGFLEANSPAKRTAIQSLKGRITAEYKQAKQLGTLDAGVQKLIDSIIPDPGKLSLSSLSNKAQVKAIDDFRNSFTTSQSVQPNNVFSQSLGTSNTFDGTSIISGVNKDGGFNFTIPTTNPLKR